MSFATHKEGEASWERFKRFHTNPFLRRNVRKSLQSLSMGSAISSIAGSSSLKQSVEERAWTTDEEDDIDSRPPKRRKTNSFESDSSKPAGLHRFPSESPRRRPLGHVTNENRPHMRFADKLQPIQPKSFYGRGSPVRLAKSSPRPSESKRASISILIPRSPIDFKKALRIEVTHIESREGEQSSEFMGHRSSIDLICRCTVALFYRLDDLHISQPRDCEVFKKSRECILRVSYINGVTTRKLLSLKPFFVTAEELYVNRTESGPSGTILDTTGFADHYFVQITVDRYGAQKDWPPFDIPFVDDPDEKKVKRPISELFRGGDASKRDLRRDLRLFCQIPGLRAPDRQPKAAPLKLYRGKETEDMPYDLGVDIKWSLPSHLSLSRSNPTLWSPRNSMSEKPDGHGVPPSPSVTHGQDGVTDSPSRVQRRRGNGPMTYNLKDLSTIQQGREPKSRKPRSGQESSGESVMVTYSFEKGDATEYGMRRQNTVDGLNCPFCSSKHVFLDDLRLHLRTDHIHFHFDLRITDPSKPKFSIQLAKSIWASSTKDLRTFQLGKPQTLFNLEKFLNGDESWARARQGPSHGQWPEHLVDQNHASSVSSSAYDSRYSSPNTSNATEGMMDVDAKESGYFVKDRRRLLVPRIKGNKPLYDAITQRILIPGEELPISDDEKDEGWLHQKHRDIILDFTDVTSEEKDYILRWNTFAMEAHMTSETHLPQVLRLFVETNESWFLQRPSRKIELGKQIDTFVMRGVITTEDYNNALDILKRAVARPKETEGVEMVREEPLLSTAKPKSLGCICGKASPVRDRVICRGPKCKIRSFHRSCVNESQIPLGRWLCDDCQGA